MLGLGVGFYKLGSTNTPMSPRSILAINEQNILFDGTNDYVDLDCVKGSIELGNGTISVWVRPSEDNATTSVVSIAADDNNMIEILYVGSTGKFRGVYRGGGSEKTIDTSAATVGSWTHVVMTWDTTADTVTMYRDGNATTVGSLDTFSGSIARVYLGAKTDSGGGGFFEGKLDEIAFSQTVLTVIQINEVFDNYSIGFTGLATYSRLTHYYTCELVPYASPYTHGILSQGSATTVCEGTLENGAVRTITDLLPPP